MYTAYRPVRREGACARAAGWGRRGSTDRTVVVPRDRARPAAAAHGDAEEGRMNGWRLTGLLSLLLIAMALYFLGVDGWDTEGIRLVIRATARTSLGLFVLAFTASAM